MDVEKNLPGSAVTSSQPSSKTYQQVIMTSLPYHLGSAARHILVRLGRANWLDRSRPGVPVAEQRKLDSWERWRPHSTVRLPWHQVACLWWRYQSQDQSKDGSKQTLILCNASCLITTWEPRTYWEHFVKSKFNLIALPQHHIWDWDEICVWSKHLATIKINTKQ